MPSTFHLLTGEYPPGAGGVGDYTALVARGLAARGRTVHVWCPGATAADPPSDGIFVHALPDRFGRDSRRVLEQALASHPGCVLLQYVPNALGARGANRGFCRWLEERGRIWDVRVMFHEPYFYFGWHPGRNALALVQRVMARHLLRASRVVYVSTSTWTRYLIPLAPAATRLIVLPIPSTVPGTAAASAVAEWRARLRGANGAAPLVVHFGTFGDHLVQPLVSLIPAVLAASPSACFVCAGRGSEAFAARFGADARVVATGTLAPADVAAVLRACDVAVQPYPDGVTTRRTTIMAALANEVPTVTTDGALTEELWRESGAVALALAGDSGAMAAVAGALLHDAPARAALAAAGLRTYTSCFGLDRTVGMLVDRAAGEPARA